MLCAGQNRVGTHCATSLLSHSYLPVIDGDEVTRTARSAALRLDTGERNVMTTGCATPTTSPVVGPTEATGNRNDWSDAARLTPEGPAMHRRGGARHH